MKLTRGRKNKSELPKLCLTGSEAPALPPPVLDKADFARRYRLGEFGNASPTWDTLKSFLQAERARHELVHIRSRHIGGRGWYDIPAYQVRSRTLELRSLYGLEPSDFYYSLMCPTHQTTIQGELYDSDRGLALLYTDVKKPMRLAFEDRSIHVGSAAARLLLRTYLNPKSQKWMSWLLSAYPGHVIEFTALSRCWGSEPGYNTMFWEVRRY